MNIQQFKCFARFGLMHIVATNICVWIRTVFKEGIKDIAAYRVARGEGVSEDFMIKGFVLQFEIFHTTQTLKSFV